VPDRASLLRHGIWLEYVTLTWNVVGAGVVLLAAVATRSAALAGFGLDSIIEIGASTVVLWELLGSGSAARTKRALQLIGWAFYGLAGYLLCQSGYLLLGRSHPGVSPYGLFWLAITFAVMLALAMGKARVGARLGNPVLVTEGRVTLVDAFLAAATLLGVGLNGAFGWWWADAAAALVIVVYGVKEGRHALQEATQLTSGV
jgi:divalent metal cation (Fe/Co/Zn/Cd) transporter